jgi:uroporphyrinogen decarboxylase
VIVGQHSDGAVGGLFPDLLEIGLQVFNPLSPTIMDPDEYKARWGNRLTFYGGIDVERLMPFGSPDEVRAEMRRMAKLMGRNGGYILQTSHTVLDDVPTENLVAYIEEVREMAGMD